MPDYTPNLNLYLPGGGGSGTIPDEIADIDKLNENFRTIDASLGGTIVPAVAGYTPDFDGNIAYARNERRLLMESAVDGGLLNIAPGANMHIGTAAERVAFTAFALPGTQWKQTDGDKSTYTLEGSAWVGGWVEVMAQGPAGAIKAQYRMNNGIVEMRGIGAKPGSTYAMFTLPAGFRPGATLNFYDAATPMSQNIQILSTGVVNSTNINAAWVSFDNVRFGPSS